LNAALYEARRVAHLSADHPAACFRRADRHKPKRSDNISMATIFRVRGLRVVIYSNDHWPPHVHVVGRDREARIELGGEESHPSLVTNNGFARTELAAALVEINRNRALLMQR